MNIFKADFQLANSKNYRFLSLSQDVQAPMVEQCGLDTAIADSSNLAERLQFQQSPTQKTIPLIIKAAFSCSSTY